MSILGIDYGNRRVGLAIAQENNVFVLPYITWTQWFELQQKLENILSEYQVKSVVIGSPPFGEVTTKVERLRQELEEKGMTVYVQDESLSTIQAEHELHMLQADKASIKKSSDSFAAGLILQEFLDQHPDYTKEEQPRL